MGHLQSLSEFVGQNQIKPALTNAIMAAKRGKFLDHVCLYGPAGTGKTLLSQIIAHELGTKCVKVDARSLKNVSEFLALVIPLRDNDVLFVDEIHGLDKKLEEMLYGLLDNQVCQYNCGGNILPIHTAKFVMVGATTKFAQISKPLRTRFGMSLPVQAYTVEELVTIIDRYCYDLEFSMTEDALEYLARVSRGTVRIAEKFITRIHDRALLENRYIVDVDTVSEVLSQLGVDCNGLNRQDREFITLLGRQFRNQPTGINTIAISMGDSEENIEETVEPFLVQSGFVIRTPRGRMLSEAGMELVAA